MISWLDDETSILVVEAVKLEKVGAFDSSIAFVTLTSIFIEADVEPVLATSVNLYTLSESVSVGTS